MKKLTMRGFINIIVALGMGLSLLWQAVPPVAADPGFTGGTGTEADPYLITTAEQLDNMRNYLDAHFKLAADINLGVPPWNEGEGWEPLGTSGAAFTGNLDGDGHVIYDLMVNRPSTNYQGLFGYLNGATVRDLRLVNVNVQGGQYTAGLAGRVNNSIIEHIHVTGELKGIQDTAGLVGYLSGGSRVDFVSTEVDVQGGQCTSGLVGYVDNPTDQIQHAYALGSVNGGLYTGGLVGRLYSGNLTNSYSRAEVHGTDTVGGAVGYVNQSNAYVSRTYSTGVVTATTTNYIGGLVGRSGGTVLNSYWDTETSEQVGSAGGIGAVGKTTAEMQQRATFVNYNFNTLWHIQEGVDYPVLQDLSQYNQPAAVALAELTGTGTEEDPYILTNADELNAMHQDLGAHYILGNDIDLSASLVWDAGRGWTPLGTSAARFTGSLDGDGHAIYDLLLNRRGTDYQGLFGYLDDAEVRDLRLENVRVQGSTYTGGLTGYADNSTLTGITVSGAVIGNNYTGGVVGVFRNGLLSGIASNVAVAGAQSTGGLVGYANFDNTHISQSYSLGDVQGTDHTGGLVGWLRLGSVTASYARGSVNGTNTVGGLIGRVGESGTTYAHVYCSYSTGLVTATTTSYIGGLAGRVHGTMNITRSYWDTETSGQLTSAGGTGVLGKTTAEMQQRATFVNYNFYTLWLIQEGVDYPVFQDLSQYNQPAAVTLTDLVGAGTGEDPYILTNADELNAMRQDLAAHYKLGNDIDLAASVVWGAGQGWEPVGISGSHFTGSLDGDGHALYNLTLNRPRTTCQGLFRFMEGAEVRDLQLVDVSVYGNEYTGGLAGGAISSTLTRIVVGGEVTGWSYTGGLAGEIRGATVVMSSSTASVVGHDRTGGLVGYSRDSRLRDSYAWGPVSGGSSVGGLVGYGQTSSVYRTYSTGPVSGTGTSVGGLMGGSTSTVADSYWDTETSGQATSAGGTGKTTAEMQQQATYAYYNFHTLWQIEEGANYPTFQDLQQYSQPAAVDLADLDGDGTAGDPYILTNADELNAMRQDLAAHYKLGNDIDLSASVVWDSGAGWVPVSTFTGSLDGEGYTLYNLTINRWGTGTQGLFGELNGATVEDLYLVDVYILGGTATGGLAGVAGSSTITRVTVNGGLIRGGTATGGVVGTIVDLIMEQCASVVSVVGESNTGGVVGQAITIYMSTGISQSYSLGVVAGTGGVGGLVGYLKYGAVSDSYARGSVSGGGSVGGLVGTAGYGLYDYGWIYRSYSSGLVSGDTNVGGLIGNLARGSASDSYWDTETSGQATSAGGAGVVGKTTTEMQQEVTFTNWDFTTVWDIEEDLSYPFHNATPGVIALFPAALTHRNDATAGHTFEVVSNLAWAATANDTWITITGGASGRDNGLVTYAIDANPSSALRTGTITISDGAGIERVFTVQQTAILTVDPPSRQHDAFAPGGYTFNVSGNVSWTATPSEDWILITAGASGSDVGMITYTVSENLALVGRDCTITVSGGGITRTVAVHQSGAIPYLEIDPGYDEHAQAASGGHIITVGANQGWTAEASESWITLDSVSGTGDGTLEYSLDANLNRKSRSGMITISGGERTMYFRVTQALAWEMSVEIEPSGGGSTTGEGAYGDGEIVTLVVSTNTGYTFENWTEDGVVVSTEGEYSFTAQRSRALQANFSINPPEFNFYLPLIVR